MGTHGRIVVTAVGRDWFGVITTVTGALDRVNAQVVKARAAAGGDTFTLLIVVDASRASVHPGCMATLLKRCCAEACLAVSVEGGDSYRRTKRIIAFDMDGTIIEEEPIAELAKAAGAEEEIRKLTEMTMEGVLPFTKAFRERVLMLRGLPLDSLERVRGSFTLVPGAREAIGRLREMGFVTALVTGAFSYFAEYVGGLLGVDRVFCNNTPVEGGILTGEVDGPMMRPEDKISAIRGMAEEMGADLRECVAVGDGANDLHMIQGVGLGIAFRAKPVVSEGASAVVYTESAAGIVALLDCGHLRSDILSKL